MKNIFIETDVFYSLLIFAFIAAAIPGPNNVMLMSTGVNFGIREGIPHFLGICIGFPAMLIVIGLGFGQIFETYPFIHEWIKWIGIGYLLYLAWKIGTAHTGKNPAQKSKPMNFWQASDFQWINPKAWIMGSSALATFTSIQSDFLVQVLLVASAFFLVTFPGAGVWLIFGVGLQQILQNPGHLKWFNRTMALLLVASIAPVVIDSLEL